MSNAPPKRLRVVAPATLEAGYEFNINLGGKDIKVTVPAGGIEEGRTFEIPYPSYDEKSRDDEESYVIEHETVKLAMTETKSEQSDEDDDEEDTFSQPPQGRWRRSLCSCCEVVTQATFFMGFFCCPIMIAQLVTRVRLTCWGKPPLESFPADSEEVYLSFNRIVISCITFLLIGYIPVIGLIAVLGYMFVVIVCIGSNLRRSIRTRYMIPPSLCPEAVDDSFCMCVCSCCSLIQMSRHTHDDKEYPGYCCTTNGLQPDAPKLL